MLYLKKRRNFAHVERKHQVTTCNLDDTEDTRCTVYILHNGCMTTDIVKYSMVQLCTQSIAAHIVHVIRWSTVMYRMVQLRTVECSGSIHNGMVMKSCIQWFTGFEAQWISGIQKGHYDTQCIGGNIAAYRRAI